MSDESFLGAIKMFAFPYAPRGYAFCNGQIMPITQNTALFTLLGTVYGGDGRTTFGLPNLQGRAPVHFGTSNTGTSYVLGEMAGNESVTISQSQMPIHTHGFTGTGSLNAANEPADSLAPVAGAFLGRASDQNGTDTPLIYAPAGSAANVALGGLNVAGQIGMAGGSQPLSVLQPFLAVNFSIVLTGLWPSRN